MDARIVRLHRQAAARADVINLAGGLPADSLIPRAALASALAECTKTDLQYSWPEGDLALRTWIAARYDIDPDRVIVTAGAQQALSLCGATLRDKTIGVGDATYPGALDAFERVAHTGDLHYVIAGVSNPHGVALDLPSGPLIVDDAYADLRFDGRATAIDAAWRIGTFSKTIAPGLRVGWLIPPREHHAAVVALKQAADLQTSMTQAAVARLVTYFDYDAHIARARAFYASRAAQLAEALYPLRFRMPEGGFSIWIELDEPCDELALARSALAEGVMFDPGYAFRPVPGPAALRVSYSNASELVTGAARLKRVLRSRRAWAASSHRG